jgi:hypothetical protein
LAGAAKNLRIGADAVAARLDYATLVLGDFRVDQFAPKGAQPGQRAGFVLPHKAAITGHIGGEDSRQPALYPLPPQFLSATSPFGAGSLRLRRNPINRAVPRKPGGAHPIWSCGPETASVEAEEVAEAVQQWPNVAAVMV